MNLLGSKEALQTRIHHLEMMKKEYEIAATLTNEEAQILLESYKDPHCPLNIRALRDKAIIYAPQQYLFELYKRAICSFVAEILLWNDMQTNHASNDEAIAHSLNERLEIIVDYFAKCAMINDNRPKIIDQLTETPRLLLGLALSLENEAVVSRLVLPSIIHAKEMADKRKVVLDICARYYSGPTIEAIVMATLSELVPNGEKIELIDELFHSEFVDKDLIAQWLLENYRNIFEGRRHIPGESEYDITEVSMFLENVIEYFPLSCRDAIDAIVERVTNPHKKADFKERVNIRTTSLLIKSSQAEEFILTRAFRRELEAGIPEGWA